MVKEVVYEEVDEEDDEQLAIGIAQAEAANKDVKMMIHKGVVPQTTPYGPYKKERFMTQPTVKVSYFDNFGTAYCKISCQYS